MTDSELMQQALEALEEINKLSIGEHAICLPGEIDTAMDALRERLAQPVQEPVAWGMRDMNGHIYDCISVEEHGRAEGDYNVPLYTTPPRREWVGLTDDDLKPVCDEYRILFGGWVHDFARAIEAKLKEKNGI